MTPTSELSRIVQIEPLPDSGIRVEVVAGPVERAALVRRFGLEALHHLNAVVRVERGEVGHEVVVQGRLQAHAVQTCVVSLESVQSPLDVAIERRYTSAAAARHGTSAALVDPEEVDLEPLNDTSLDLGEIVAEEFGLALDPYPRADHALAALPDLGPDVTVNAPEPKASPFAALRELKAAGAPQRASGTN